MVRHYFVLLCFLILDGLRIFHHVNARTACALHLLHNTALRLYYVKWRFLCWIRAAKPIGFMLYRDNHEGNPYCALCSVEDYNYFALRMLAATSTHDAFSSASSTTNSTFDIGNSIAAYSKPLGSNVGSASS